MTSKFCLEQLGQAIKFIPFFLSFKDLSMSNPTFISLTGSEAKETLSVSLLKLNDNFLSSNLYPML